MEHHRTLSARELVSLAIFIFLRKWDSGEETWGFIKNRTLCGSHGENLGGWNRVQNDLYIRPEGTLETKISASHFIAEGAEA